MKKTQGFTLIELVVVIVILGILAATALPRFVDFGNDAGNAAANGVAGALASSSSIQYAAQLAGRTISAPLNAAAVCNTATLQPLVNGVTLADGVGNTTNNSTYNVSAGTGSCASNAGNTVTCNVIGQRGTAQTATLVCTN